MSAELALVKLERQVLASAEVSGWLKAVDELRALLADETADVKARVLAMVAPRIEKRALAAVADAFGLGKADALDIVRDPAVVKATKKAGPSKRAAAPLDGLDKAGRDALAKAKKLARAGVEAETFLAPLFGHANRVKGTVSDAINRGGNEGSTAVADAAGLPTVWVAETNACVACLAYSGRSAKPGDAFPGGLTYGKKSYYADDVMTPPRHPNCRCTVEPLVAKEYADALRREADRSVLRGFSLESESMATRVDAAKRLVDKGVDAPKSVVAFSKRSVAAGKFPTRGRP